MSYKKSIKGDNNTANEQLAHNRIFIDMHGAGPLIMALFIIGVETSSLITSRRWGLHAGKPSSVTAPVSCSEVGQFGRPIYEKSLIMWSLGVITSALVWMITHEGALLAVMVTLAFVCFFTGAGAIGTMFVIRYWSGTQRQIASDKAAMQWEQIVHYADSHIIARDPRLRIENARDVQEVRHYNDRPQITEAAESLTSYDLPASDMFK